VSFETSFERASPLSGEVLAHHVSLENDTTATNYGCRDAAQRL
jgi:hypothetical protein